MTGGLVEATLELWALSLREVKGRIRPLFQQERMAVSAGLFLDALLGPERRKTGWMRAEAAGDPGPWRQQALLGRAPWDADALRDVVRDDAVETLSEPDAVLVLDETGFLKQGNAHNETRSWHGWHRHVALVMLALALMAAVRHHAHQLPPPKTKGRVRQPAH